MYQNTIAIIGGTGKSGKYLVQHLIATGHHIKLLLRDPLKAPLHNRVQVVKGDGRNYQSIETLLNGCYAIISTLGQPKDESAIFSDATGNVLQAMQYHGITRYIVTTGLSVSTPFDHKDEQTQKATDWMYQHYPETTGDKQKEYECLVQSAVDWTLVRLPLIQLTTDSQPVRACLDNCPGNAINATDLASFLVNQLADNSYLKRSPFLANILSKSNL